MIKNQVICFLGSDGSGKSTIIDELLKRKLPFTYHYFHLKPILKPKEVDVKVVVEPHKYPPYSKPKSYIKLLYLIYQYNFGWVNNILKLRTKPSLVIFDRYFDDLLVDNKRYRYGGSIFIAKLARRLIPKPDIYFILTTDAKIIYNRKQEVPFEELERQIGAYRSLADGKRYFNIDVNRTPHEIANEVLSILTKKMDGWT